MDRNEFIGTLRACLTGQICDEAVEEHIDYYYQYISDEIAKGRGEQAVLEELGNPRWIAKTILDTAGQKNHAKETFVYTDGEKEKKEWRFQWNSWYGKTLIWVLVIAFLVLIFQIVGGILALLLPVAIPVLLVVLVIQLFRRS